MAKSKYTKIMPEILELQSQGKTTTEIAEIINKKRPGFGATESAVRGAIKRNNDNENQKKDLKVVSEIRDDQSTVGKLILQGKLLKNLEILKAQYEDINEKCSILNETLHETIIQKNEENNKGRLRCIIASGWILTMLFAMFAGYYIGRCYSRPAFHYILTLTGIPAGVFLGFGLSYAKKKIKKKA